MKGLDTNVLVRFLTQDDPEQGRKANRYIEETIASGELLFVNNIVLCEMIWVLESAYGYSKQAIVGVMEKILSTIQLEVEDKSLIWRALDDYRRSQADFSDCLVGRLNLSRGCVETASFDKALSGQPGFQLL